MIYDLDCPVVLLCIQLCLVLVALMFDYVITCGISAETKWAIHNLVTPGHSYMQIHSYAHIIMDTHIYMYRQRHLVK